MPPRPLLLTRAAFPLLPIRWDFQTREFGKIYRKSNLTIRSLRVLNTPIRLSAPTGEKSPHAWVEFLLIEIPHFARDDMKGTMCGHAICHANYLRAAVYCTLHALPRIIQPRPLWGAGVLIAPASESVQHIQCIRAFRSWRRPHRRPHGESYPPHDSRY